MGKSENLTTLLGFMAEHPELVQVLLPFLESLNKLYPEALVYSWGSGETKFIVRYPDLGVCTNDYGYLMNTVPKTLAPYIKIEPITFSS